VGKTRKNPNADRFFRKPTAINVRLGPCAHHLIYRSIREVGWSEAKRCIPGYERGWVFPYALGDELTNRHGFELLPATVAIYKRLFRGRWIDAYYLPGTQRQPSLCRLTLVSADTAKTPSFDCDVCDCSMKVIQLTNLVARQVIENGRTQLFNANRQVWKLATHRRSTPIRSVRRATPPLSDFAAACRRSASCPRRPSRSTGRCSGHGGTHRRTLEIARIPGSR
jgi:hypothetical protein